MKQKIEVLADTTAEVTIKAALLTRIQEYEKLIGEYQLMIDSKPPALIIVEDAKPSGRPDKPDVILAIVAAGVLGFLFSLLAALLLHSRKKISV